MNKRWLFSMALLALVLPFLHIYAMEAEVKEKDEKSEQQSEVVPFLERVQKSGLSSPDGLLVARCTYTTNAFGDFFLAQEYFDKFADFGCYPWQCFIKICMANGAQKQVGMINASSTLLRKMEWQDGNQLRILLTELTGVRQLKWHDYFYALNGTFLKRGMDDRQRALRSQAKAILSAQ
ncbi:hypothetical protein E3J61_02125 [Candidatus Dependentiae bacterium]|nr:MAG: hypothetical protein E3J61_02125 [Candidatus Dependentiae bacterium]